MKRRLEIHSLAVLALVIAFDWFFEFTKHDAELKRIIPFGEDPYDAAGSYCLIVSTLLAALCFVRALWSLAMKPASGPRKVFLARTQLAIALGILVTIVTDAVALTRHASQWIAKPAASELLALLAGVAALALVSLVLVLRPAVNIPLTQKAIVRKRAAITIALSIVAMFLFPDNRVSSLPIHLLAMLLGSLIVAANQAALAIAIIPYDGSERQMQSYGRGWDDGWILWPLIALAGAVIGAVALVAEFRESGMGHRTLPKIVMLVYVGAGMSCLLIAFAFLKRPLGLSLRSLF
jgi:hypothetical protein